MPRPPNILLITTDQQRHDALGINGNQILRTPNLDHLAARGMNFTRCYSTCPVCIPARRTLISGLHPDTHGMPGYRDGWEFDPPHTLPGVLRQAGYQTQLIGKLHLHPQRKRYGFDHMILSESANWRPNSPSQKENDYCTWLMAQGVSTHSNAHGISGNGRVARPFHLTEEFHHSSWVARQATEFFDGWRDPRCPWFMHLSFVAPHPPLVPPQAYWDRYAHEPALRPVLGDWVPSGPAPLGASPDAHHGPFPERDIHDAIAGYYGLINHIDDQIHYVLDRYAEIGNPRAKEPLLILFSSDHGEMLGDHHQFRKSLPYEASAHVPLFITGRNFSVPQGTSEVLTCWEDLMPTILDLAGVPIPSGLDGHSLVPVMQGQRATVRETLHGGCLDGASSNQFVVHGDWKYIWFAKTHEEQVFNLRHDPRELHDRSGDQTVPLAALRALLAQRLAGRPELAYDPVKLTPCANRPPRAIWG